MEHLIIQGIEMNDHKYEQQGMGSGGGFKFQIGIHTYTHVAKYTLNPFQLQRSSRSFMEGRNG